MEEPLLADGVQRPLSCPLQLINGAFTEKECSCVGRSGGGRPAIGDGMPGGRSDAMYGGTLLGTARLDAGQQPTTSCRLLHLPARLDAMGLAHHAGAILADATCRHMELDAVVEIAGEAAVLLWSRRFSVRIDSHIVVDPVFLEVIEKDNRSEMQLYLT